MTGTGTERRKYPRYKPAPGTTILCTRDEGGPNLIQRVIDVSALGVCFVASSPLVEGTSVRLEILLPGEKARVNSRGKVRWIQFLESRGREAHAAGVEFESLVQGLGQRGADSAVLDIFLTLRVAVAQLRLYPKDSPQVLKVATDTYHSIHSFLESSSTLTLSKTPRGLLVNGRPLPERGTISDSLESTMTQLLSEAQVKSVTFRKGLTLDELITFLNALTRKFWDVKDGKEINRRLRDERVNQVTVDEVQYVALGAGDIVIEDAARKLAGGATELSKLLGSLDQVIDSAAQEGLGAEARLHMMKRLLDKDPTLLKQVGETAAPGPVSPGGGDGRPAGDDGRITFDHAREALGELARLLKEGPAELHAPLRKVGGLLVDAFKHDPRLASVMGTILSEQAVEALPGQAAPERDGLPAEAAAVSRLKTILQMQDDERVQALQQEGNQLLDELTALGQGERVQSMLGALSSMLLDRTARRRLTVARTLNNLRRGLERSGEEAVVEAFEQAVRNGLEVEREANIYSVLADMLGFLADFRIRKGGVERARALLELLHRHYAIKDPAFTQRGELAYIVLERVASGVGFSSLAEKVRLGDAEAVRVVEALGAAATRFLIREIRTADSAARRMQLAALIARAGSGAGTVLMDELQKTSSSSDLMHLIEVLPHAMPPELCEMTLGGLLRHAVPAVRRRVAGLLSELLSPRAGSLVSDALGKEADPPTRVGLVEALGRIRHRPAVEELSRLVEDRAQPEDLRAAACLSLGRIGDLRVVPVLSKIYFKGEKGFTSIFRVIPAAVRGAAAKALASFPTNKDARDALRSAREDKDPSVRAIAQQALYAPLQDCFGERALAVQPVAVPAEIVAVQKAGGVLAEIPLEVLLERLGKIEASGTLHLVLGGPTARVSLDSGVVVAAEFEGRREQEAILFLAGKRDGYWLFQPGELPPARRMLMPVSAVLEEMKRAKPGSSAVFPSQQ